VITIKVINDFNESINYKSKHIEKLCITVLNSEKCKKASILIILSCRELVHKLKKKYFDLDHYTDVIAFNLENKNEPIDGEVYISIDDVLENSKTYSNSFNDEFKRVLIHGVLHLLGYDDKEKDDIKIMRSLEEKYLLNSNKEIIHLEC